MKRTAVVGLVAGATVIVVAAAGVWWLLGRPQSPQDAAHAYLDALEQGDYATIAGMSSDTLDPHAEAIVEQAFTGASGYVSDARIENLAVDEDGFASVDADVEIAGERRTLSFAMESTGGRWMLSGDHFATMRVESTLGDRTGGDSAWVGDALVPTHTDVSVLPAEYAVEAAPRGILTGTATAAVGNDEPVIVPLETALSAEATALAQEQLDAYAETCAQPAESVPANCGIAIPWTVDLASLERIAFRIEEPPLVVLAEDGTSFDATGGVIVATATGTTRAGGPGAFTYRSDDWALRGSVSFEGDEMVLAVR